MQHIGDFNYPRLADFGAAISGANKSQCQEVLEELDVSSTNFFFIFCSCILIFKLTVLQILGSAIITQYSEIWCKCFTK